MRHILACVPDVLASSFVFFQASEQHIFDYIYIPRKTRPKLVLFVDVSIFYIAYVLFPSKLFSARDASFPVTSSVTFNMSQRLFFYRPSVTFNVNQFAGL